MNITGISPSSRLPIRTDKLLLAHVKDMAGSSGNGSVLDGNEGPPASGGWDMNTM